MNKKSLLKCVSLIMTAVLVLSGTLPAFALPNGDFEISPADGGVSVDKYLGDGETVDIPETIDGKAVTALGISAFENNKTIKSVTIPESVKSVLSSAFSGCSALESVSLPEEIENIGAYAFLNCVMLDNIRIPNCSVGFGAFQGCSALNNIEFADSIKYVDRYAFEKTKWLESKEAGVIYASDCAYTYISDGEDGEIVIKDSTRSISPYAFDGNKLITDVYIPDSVTSIGVRAFKDCTRLENIYISDKVKEIGSQAFGYKTESNSLVLSDRFTIYCRENSEAQKYAQDNSINFELVDNCKHDKNKQYEITSTATCEEDGILTYTCRKCHYKETVSIPKLGHIWGEWVTVSTLGCESDGVEERTCSRCSKTEQNVTPALGHKWGDWKVSKNPTCDVPGENKRECAICGGAQTVEIAPTGHKWSEWVETKHATCTDDGENQRYCTVCGANETKKIPSSGSHTWSEWMQIKAPTKTEEGIIERSCSVCKKKETKTIPKRSADDADDELILNKDSKLKLDKEKRLITGIYIGTISDKLIKEFISYTHGETVLVVDTEKTEAVTGDSPVGTGNLVVLAYEGKPQDYYYAVVLGDADGNGKLTAADARTALRIAAKLESPTDAVFAALDLNSDGSITIAEARMLLRVSAKLETLPGMPAEETSLSNEDESRNHENEKTSDVKEEPSSK